MPICYSQKVPQFTQKVQLPKGPEAILQNGTCLSSARANDHSPSSKSPSMGPHGKYAMYLGHCRFGPVHSPLFQQHVSLRSLHTRALCRALTSPMHSEPSPRQLGTAQHRTPALSLQALLFPTFLSFSLRLPVPLGHPCPFPMLESYDASYSITLGSHC